MRRTATLTVGRLARPLPAFAVRPLVRSAVALHIAIRYKGLTAGRARPLPNSPT